MRRNARGKALHLHYLKQQQEPGTASSRSIMLQRWHQAEEEDAAGQQVQEAGEAAAA